MVTRTAAAIESSRLMLLDDLNQQKSATERNRWGQFATPPELAEQIVRESLRLMPERKQVRYLEPGFGTGSFYSALRRTKTPIAMAKGIELDPLFAAAARNLWKGTGLRIVQGDFTELSPPATEASRFDLVIGNPPYVRHQHLDVEKKRILQKRIADQLQIRLSGLAGLYTHFLLLSQQWMKSGAIGSWLVPSEFMDVNYGQAIREFLVARVTLLRIHRFDSSNLQFDDALVSSGVVFFRNERPAPQHQVRFTSGETLRDSQSIKLVSTTALQVSKKWTGIVDRNGFKKRQAKAASRTVLADLFWIKRGVATGCNRFFVLSERQIAEQALPLKFLQPILPSPRYLRSDVVRARPDGSPDIETRRFLLSCSLNPAQVKRQSMSLHRYLESGRREGVDQGYLSRNRNLWYEQEVRDSPLFLCTYMGRTSTPGKSPFRFLWNQSNAIAANVYLLMYPKPDFAKIVLHDDGIQKRMFDRLRSIHPESMIREGRVYGGGLHKVEPKELAKVPIDIGCLD